MLGDQKYEIEYSDGDVEKGVAEEMIRALETEDEPPAKRDASPEREASKFAAGDAVAGLRRQEVSGTPGKFSRCSTAPATRSNTTTATSRRASTRR